MEYTEYEDDTVYNEVVLDEDKYDYWELYYNTKEVCHNLFAEKVVLDEMNYAHFFEYILNITNGGEMQWVKLENTDIFKITRKKCAEWWKEEYKRELFEIKLCIEKYLRTEINFKNVSDFCYTYSSSGSLKNRLIV